MAEQRTRFIRTVPFGGYDRTDVDKRLENLYTQLYDLKAQLREAKLMLEKVKKGSDADAAQEYALATERAKLTEYQVKNETCTEKLRRAEDDLKAKDSQIEQLKAELERAKEECSEAKSKLDMLNSNGDASVFGAIFTEAQKSKEMILSASKEEARKLEDSSKELAGKILTDADNKAAQIIYEAEHEAADVLARAQQQAEQMKVASENLHSVLLEDVKSLSERVSSLKTVIGDFEQASSGMLDDAAEILSESEDELTAGGVPVFRSPREIKPQYPEEPEITPVEFSEQKETQKPKESPKPEESKKQQELEKLKEMAQSMEGGPKKPEHEAPAPKQGGKSLEELARQAASLGGAAKPETPPKKEPPKKKGVDLAALAKQAEALGKDKP